MNFNLPKLIGHRGIKDLAPENTLRSIYEAFKINLKWVEIDVKISKDKIPFLLHDNTLERTTSGSGIPLNYKYSDIFKLDAGSWFNEKYKNLYPPTLEEVLEFCSEKNIGVNIELKPNKGFEKENVEAVVKLIKKHKFTCKYYFSSFDWFSAIFIKKLLPESYVGILIDSLNKKNDITNILHKCKKYNFFSCGINEKILSKNIVDYYKKYGMIVSAYSIKNIEKVRANKLWSFGVDSVFIDNPTTYKEILKLN